MATNEPEFFIKNRVRQYQSWYDRKAVYCKRNYLLMRGFAVVAGSAVPVLLNIEWAPIIYGFPLAKLSVTVISLLVVIAVSLESVLHYREQWKNYRSTEQFIGHAAAASRLVHCNDKILNRTSALAAAHDAY